MEFISTCVDAIGRDALTKLKNDITIGNKILNQDEDLMRPMTEKVSKLFQQKLYMKI